MTIAILSFIAGVALMLWSAARFVEGAAVTAKYARMPPLLIGMVIVGFGTSAPEMVVSALAAAEGNPGLALGNAYGSNITNIALILGIVALLSPIAVHSRVLRKELPLLTLITLLAAAQLFDGVLSRHDALILLVVFALLMGWSIYQGIKQRPDAPADTLGDEVTSELKAHPMPLKHALWWLVIGLALLIISSRLLVWSAVTVAHSLGVSDLIIGLTIVALGTSLPELASSVIAARKGEHDIALGNVLGSNLFNTLAVVGVAAAIQPLSVAPEVLYRDWSLMAALTVSLFVMGYGFRTPGGHINRIEGGMLLLVYITYTVYLIYTMN